MPKMTVAWQGLTLNVHCMTANEPSDINLTTATSAAGPGLIARQPIVDTDHAVIAYELFDRSTAENEHTASSDISLLFNTLADTGNELRVDAKTLFINRTHQSLMEDQLDLVQPERVVIKVAPVAGHDAQTIADLQRTLTELREQGFRFAFNHTIVAPAYQAWQPLADFVKLDVRALTPELLPAIVAAIRARTKAQIIAEKIETPDLFSTSIALGVTLFQGYWVGQPKVVKMQVVAPAEARVLQLFNLVRTQASIDQIEVILKHDAVLGFNLLRMINSAGFGLRQEVTSFRHAVMLMGMKRLFRWTALLITSARANGSPPVISTTAVVRGRMMELLGSGTLSQEECDTAFVVGIFSLLDEMLCVPMQSALDLLALPTVITDALLHGTGIYGRMLALTKAAERNDEAAFASAAIELNYSNHHVNVAHMEALVWADVFGL